MNIELPGDWVFVGCCVVILRKELFELELKWMEEDVEIAVDEDKPYNLYLILRIVDSRNIRSLIFKAHARMSFVSFVVSLDHRNAFYISH